MSVNDYILNSQNSMQEKVERFKKDLSSLRTGRANPQLLDNIFIDYYGTKTPLKQIAAINVPEARTIEIRPWDKSVIDEVEIELKKADLGTNPTRQGDMIRINLPPMNEEQRKKMTKLVYKMAEDAKVAVRNERRDILEKLKKAQKSSEITEDDLKRYEDSIQKITDKNISEIEIVSQEKEKELLTI